MTIEELIVSVCEASTELPCFHNKFTKDESTYLVYNYFVSNEYFDNKAIYDLFTIQIHVVAPYGVELYELKQKLKKDLEDNGFIYPPETDASDEDSQHYVLETQKWWNVSHGIS